MSYTKQTWTTGDTVTATKLNHMEDGIAGAGASYDVVIKLDKGFADESLSDADLHLVKGDYASVMAKATNGEPITAYVYAVYFNDPVNTYAVAYGVSVYIIPDEGEEYCSFVAMYQNDGSVLGIALDSNNDLFLD